MALLYPNFYSLHTTPATQPLEPRNKRRSWNAFLENPIFPYSVYSPVQKATLHNRRCQKCSSEAPTSQKISTFLPDNSNMNGDEVDDDVLENPLEEQAICTSPIPPIAVVKPTLGKMDGQRLRRPQPCYGLVPLPATSTDLPSPYMRISTPEFYFKTLCSSSFDRPVTSLPRRRTQVKREVLMPVARHSVFEYPNVVDYGPLQNVVIHDLTLRRRAQRHSEVVTTAPIGRRGHFINTTGTVVATMEQTIPCKEEQSPLLMVMPNCLPSASVRSEHPRRSTRACLVSNYEQSLANMAQRLQGLTVSAAEKDSELRELREIIDSMVHERSSSSCTVDAKRRKPPLSPSNAIIARENSNIINDSGEVDEENSNRCSSSTSKFSGSRKGGWLRSSFDRAFRRRGSQSSLTSGDTNSHSSQSKLTIPLPLSAYNSPEHHSSHSNSLRKNFVRATSMSVDVISTQMSDRSQLTYSNCVEMDDSRVDPTSSAPTSNSTCWEVHSRCHMLKAEVESLRKELTERERRLTDAQLQALASEHQVNQLRDQLNFLFQQLSLLRADSERLHPSAAVNAVADKSSHVSTE